MKSFLFIYNFFLSIYVDCYFSSVGQTNSTVKHDSEMEFKIAGGVSAYLNWVPFNVQFFNLGGMCGGSIITKKTVLTAAHCFDFNKNVAEMKVFSNSRFVLDMKSFIHNVWRFKIHEEYSQKTAFSNDIAVIMIVDEFIYTDSVQLVPLCNSEIWRKENETFYVSGWGETKHGEGVLNQELRMTYLNLVPNDQCEAQLKVKLSADMFCLFGDRRRDTCRGDSGGGVVWKNMLVGIVSHGEGCLKKPSVYVNVSYLRKWVQQVVNQLKHKFCSEKGSLRNSTHSLHNSMNSLEHSIIIINSS